MYVGRQKERTVDTARRLPVFEYRYSHKEGTEMEDLNKKGAANEAKGAVKETIGKMKGDLGDAIDDSSMHAEGRGDQLKGKIQKNVGKAERALDPDTHHDSTDTPRRD
jgi:uncharacterized protein YjbJ (UPF0337 family)